jgi:hypothetical protein
MDKPFEQNGIGRARVFLDGPLSVFCEHYLFGICEHVIYSPYAAGAGTCTAAAWCSSWTVPAMKRCAIHSARSLAAPMDGSRFLGVIRDSAGNLYGTTWEGGNTGYGGCVAYNVLGDAARPQQHLR